MVVQCDSINDPRILHGFLIIGIIVIGFLRDFQPSTDNRVQFPTQLLNCPSFSMENSHPLLVTKRHTKFCKVNPSC